MGNELSQQLSQGGGNVPNCCEARKDEQTVMQAVRATKNEAPMRGNGRSQPHGVGLVFQTARDGRLTVSSFIKESSAYESGLVRDGDVLCAVNGQDVGNIPPEYLDRILLGEKDTWVQMKFLRKTDAKGGGQGKIYVSPDGSLSSPSSGRGVELGRGAEDTIWASSKMRSMAPTYQSLVVDLCRTTPSGILCEAVNQANEEARARRGMRGVKTNNQIR